MRVTTPIKSMASRKQRHEAVKDQGDPESMLTVKRKKRKAKQKSKNNKDCK